MEENEFLTTPEVASYLGVAQGTVRTYMQKGILKPCGRKTGVRGNPSLFRKSDLDVLKSNPAWGSRNVYTKRGRSLYIKLADRPTEDEIIPSGGIIHWSERYRLGNHTWVPITCAVCEVKVDKLDGRLWKSIQTGEFTGCCPHCARRKPRKTAMSSDGKITRSDGYIYRHIRTFSIEEQRILEQMRLNNGIYIPEHRAIMAIHIGKPLQTDEAVHHIDGDKTNNRIENLQLYRPTEHSRNHANQLVKVLSLEGTISQLQDEIDRLKGILESNNIAA